MLGYFLYELFFHFFWKEFSQEMKCYGRVLGNLLVQDLGEQIDSIDCVCKTRYKMIYKPHDVWHIGQVMCYFWMVIIQFDPPPLGSPLYSPVSLVLAKHKCPLLCTWAQRTRSPSNQQCDTPGQTGLCLSTSPGRHSKNKTSGLRCR